MEIIEGLKKVTLSKKKVNQLNKTILLVGDTGTGKSTLINAMANYAMVVKWEDDVWFEIVGDETTRQSYSQSADVTMYQIFGFEGKMLPVSLTVIDMETAEMTKMITTSWRGCWSGSPLMVEFTSSSNNGLSDRLRYIFESAFGTKH